MSDTLLVQQADGPHIHLLNLTVQPHSAYCTKHAIDYQPVYGSALTGKDKSRHAFWAKVALIQKGLGAGYERVIWLDSDCYIADDDRDIREACPADGMGLVWHGKGEWPEGPECYDHYNAGAIYCGNGPDCQRLMRTWWRSPDDGHFWHDQHALNRYAIPHYEAMMKRPAPIKRLGYEWNSVPLAPFTAEKPIVAAWHGCWPQIDIRAEAMREYIRNNTMRRMVERCSKDEAMQKAEYCMSVGNYNDALRFFAQAMTLGADGPGFFVEYARCCYRLKMYPEAAMYYRQVCEYDPDNVAIWQSLSSCYDYMGEHELNGEAIAEGMRVSPNFPGLMHNRMLWQLRDGQWTDGFDGMKWQYLVRERIARCPEPEWTREGFARRLFVWAEQGLGDTVMLARYIPDLEAPNVLWEVQKPLVALMEAQCWPGVEIVAQEPDKGVPWQYDAHVGMFTLPKLIGVTVENTTGEPYLKPPAEHVEKWRGRIGGDGFRVGFSWAGSSGHGNNQNRNAQAVLFDDLVKTPGTRWFSLQRGIEIDEESVRTTPEVTWIGDEFEDMADTAGALASLDLVITIDSAILHMCGALGVPCWGLISRSSDWRWLVDREDTCWYDSVRLFRQKTLGDWAEVIGRVEEALKEKMNDGN